MEKEKEQQFYSFFCSSLQSPKTQKNFSKKARPDNLAKLKMS